MEVLVACEISGIVRDAFRELGHNAYSNDLEDSGHPYHIVGECKELICTQTWDLIIMHPPCTALAVSGNHWYGVGKEKHQERLDAIEWTMDLWDLACVQSKAVCMENPVGVLPMKATQYIEPWQFGHGETKKTGLWLYNLPLLEPTDIVEGRSNRIHMMGETKDRARKRSETYVGIAKAMAEQWGKDENS